MRELLIKIAGRLESGSYVNEASVRIGIIEPILAALGWDTTDPLSVMPEYSSEGRRVDYALCAFPSRPTAFIEAKAVGKVEAADRQLFEYAFHEGVPFAVLTDGRTWSFYLPSAQGSYEDRRLHKLDLQERDPEECALIFERYLAHTRLRNGQAQADAQKDYASKANERIAFDTLNKAWSELTNEPDPLLIELLVERTEALCGIRPPLEVAEAFLLGRPKAPAAVALFVQPVTPKPVADTTTVSPTVRGYPSKSLNCSFQGRHIGGKDANATYLELLRSFFAKFPDKAQQMATAAKGRTRNHIARTPADVYPDRPDLASSSTEIAPGWFAGTNIANREKGRIIKAACEACGLGFGRDVIFDLPNI